MDYTVKFEVSVTAANPTQAAQFALDDLRDRTIGPWNAEVVGPTGTAVVSTGTNEAPTCGDCGSEADKLTLCPDGAEICASCFDAGHH